METRDLCCSRGALLSGGNITLLCCCSLGLRGIMYLIICELGYNWETSVDDHSQSECE